MNAKPIIASIILGVFATSAYALPPKDKAKPKTETTDFSETIGERRLMSESAQMLADFMTYAKSIYTSAGKNSRMENMGYFKARSAGRSNEDGVRTNLDICMICSFLYKYGREEGVRLPEGITWSDIRHMAYESLHWAYSTHRSLMLARTTDGRYWGSVEKNADGRQGAYQWESCLWVESLALALWMQDECNLLSQSEIEAALTVIKAEADYELTREIPTGFEGDTKAEENGWDTNVLAAACALMPNDENAARWMDKLKRFAMNCNSTRADMTDSTPVDGRPVSEWIEGPVLYDDYTLQNHNYFHTSYQNAVTQELSESLLIMLMTGRGRVAIPEALRWGQQRLFDNVLKRLALADGELAMPNGNDWSMFLYDQLPAFTAMACIFRDADALMLEERAFRRMKARQQTTTDGSWMLNSDIGPRRMGVTAHRVMMTYLMHNYMPTSDMRPTRWDDFRKAQAETHFFETQNVVRSMTRDRFTCFSWSKGLKNASGIISVNNPETNNIIIPFKQGGTGNFLGSFTVGGKNRTETVTPGPCEVRTHSYVMNGTLSAAGGALEQKFSLFSSSGNAVVMIDHTVPSKGESVLIEREEGGTMAVSIDPFTSTERTLFSAEGTARTDGTEPLSLTSDWVNIDGHIGIVAKQDGNRMQLTPKKLVNSIYTSQLIPSFVDKSFTIGENGIARCFVYYSSVDAPTTARLAQQTIRIDSQLPSDWSGALVPDVNGRQIFIVRNFGTAEASHTITLSTPDGAPLLTGKTDIDGNTTRTIITLAPDSCTCQETNIFVGGGHDIWTYTDKNSPRRISIWAIEAQKITLTSVTSDGKKQIRKISLKAGENTVRLKPTEEF